MASVYVPKGTKRKSKVELGKTAEAYLTNGYYDQRKSAMIAEARKAELGSLHKKQAQQRKYLIASATIFAKMEKMVSDVTTWKSGEFRRVNYRDPQNTTLRDGRR